MKKAVLAVLILVLCVGGYFAWEHYRLYQAQEMQQAKPGAAAQMAQGQQQQRPPVEVLVQTIAPQVLTLSQELPGRTQAFRVAEIRPQVSGIVLKRLFEEGSDVEAGQQLYQIDAAPYQAAYNSALADLEKAKANIKSIQAKQKRYSNLVKVGGVSKQEYDDIVASLAQSKADVMIAEAAVATAKINLDYTKVFSPISGRIGKSTVTEGALVTANQTDPLAVVQQFDKIYVDATQSVGDLRKMRNAVGQDKTQISATLIIEGDREPYRETGLLQFADVSVDPGTGTVQLRILFDNPRLELLPGMFVKAQVTLGQDENAIMVPQKTVTRHADGSTTVWLIDDQAMARVQPVTLARAVGSNWLIAKGLEVGDQLVVSGQVKLQPGAPVKAVDVNEVAKKQPLPRKQEQQVEQKKETVTESATATEPSV